MQHKSTEQLVQEHNAVIHKLDRDNCLRQEISYIRIPFQGFETDVFFERRDTGRKRLTNSLGQTFPSHRVKVHRAMGVQSTIKDSGKRSISIDTRAERPNVVFFSDAGEELDINTQQMVGDIAFNLWRQSQNGLVSERDINQTLKKLSSVVLHHIDKQDPSDVSRFLMFTDAEDGRYYAPFAYLGNKPTQQALADMQRVIERGDLPDHVPMHDIGTIVGLKKLAAPYAAKGLQDIARMLRDPKGVDGASQLMEQHFKINPRQAVDLFDLVMNKKNDRVVVEELANSALLQTAGGESASTMTSDERARIMQRQFVEALRNKC